MANRGSSEERVQVVCYIGIAFRKTDPSANSRTACCAAQMFLDSGDGVVFLGKSGAWYSADRKQFHLSEQAAEDLLAGVLKEYKALDGQPLTEIFLTAYPEYGTTSSVATKKRVRRG